MVLPKIYKPAHLQLFCQSGAATRVGQARLHSYDEVAGTGHNRVSEMGTTPLSTQNRRGPHHVARVGICGSPQR